MHLTALKKETYFSRNLESENLAGGNHASGNHASGNHASENHATGNHISENHASEKEDDISCFEFWLRPQKTGKEAPVYQHYRIEVKSYLF